MELEFQEFNFDSRLPRYKSEYSLLTKKRYLGADNSIYKEIADKLREKKVYLTKDLDILCGLELFKEKE